MVHRIHQGGKTTSRRSNRLGEHVACALFGLGLAVLVTACVANGETTIVAEPAAAVTAAPSTSPTTDVAPAQPTPTAEIVRQVLVATQEIPRGTSIRELMDAPSLYLSAQALPATDVLSDAIASVADLQELSGLVLAVAVLPGEQLLLGSMRDPSNFSAPAPGAFLEVPAGHDVHVLTLPPSRAFGGYLRAGETVNIIETTYGPDGQGTSTFLLDTVEVLNVESTLPIDGVLSDESQEAIQTGETGEFIISIAVKPDEDSKLSDALAESAIITLAVRSTITAEFAVAIEMTRAQALDGQVRMEDVVDIFSVADRSDRAIEPELVASEVHVLNVSSTYFDDSAASTYSLIVSVELDELLALTTAVANGQLALAES